MLAAFIIPIYSPPLWLSVGGFVVAAPLGIGIIRYIVRIAEKPKPMDYWVVMALIGIMNLILIQHLLRAYANFPTEADLAYPKEERRMARILLNTGIELVLAIVFVQYLRPSIRKVFHLLRDQ